MDIKSSDQVLKELSSKKSTLNNRDTYKMLQDVAGVMMNNPNDVSAIVTALGDHDLVDFTLAAGYIAGFATAKLQDSYPEKIVGPNKNKEVSKKSKNDNSFSVSRYRGRR